MMKKGTHLVLKDGREILLQDDLDIFLSIRSNHEVICSLSFSCPPGGYGGGTLLLSPSEQYLIFSFFSGESEEAYSLFRIEDNRLVPVFDSGYLYGEGADYIFSDDEAFLFQSLLGGFGPWYIEDAETDENGAPYFRYGEINILDVESGHFNRHQFHVYPPENWDEEIEEPSYISSVEGGAAIRVAMPWGEERLPLPLADTIVFRPGEGGNP